MPSHLKEKLSSDKLAIPPEGVSLFDVAANDHADSLAGKAAKQLQLPNAITQPYIHYARLIKHIQKRITTIAMYFPARPKHVAPKPEPVPRVRIEELLAQTTHTIQCVASRYTCSVCNDSFKISDPGFKHWLSLQCVAPASPDRFCTPVRIEGSIHIGNRITHVSHRLYKHRG